MTGSLLCLMGPTASGKTELALQLAQQFPCEIISVDSAMVYQHMDIGTAKPEHEHLQKVPHHLINIRQPTEPYSVADFRQDALIAIEAIQQRNKIPLLVGGTMLYFHALQQGLAPLPASDRTIRNRLSAEALEKGWPALHQRLAAVDPVSANRIHPHDAQRIQRALEIHALTGQSRSDFFWQQNQTLPYHRLNLALIPSDRALLHQQIAQRFETMLKQGFIEEVDALRKIPGIQIDLPAIRAVGYRQIWFYLDGQLTYQEMVERSVIATRQLAKRQLTWLRRWSDTLIVCNWPIQLDKLFFQIKKLLSYS